MVRYERPLLKSKIPPATRRTSSTENPEDDVSDATFLIGAAGSSLAGAGRRLRASMVVCRALRCGGFGVLRRSYRWVRYEVMQLNMVASGFMRTAAPGRKMRVNVWRDYVGSAVSRPSDWTIDATMLQHSGLAWFGSADQEFLLEVEVDRVKGGLIEV